MGVRFSSLGSPSKGGPTTRVNESAERLGRQPRQARGIETRRRVYEAAIAEYRRVGVDAARVEDIVAAAGVS